MPRPRADAFVAPKVSWNDTQSATAVTYGILVGTPRVLLLLPSKGADTAGLMLELRWTRGGASIDDIYRLLSDPQLSTEQAEQILLQALPAWPGRCVFPVAELTRFEILSGWKLWLGISAILRVGGEPPTSIRMPSREHLEEMRALYAPYLRA